VKQIGPFFRIGNVIAVGITVLPEVISDFDVERLVGIGEPVELDAKFLAHDAARTFRTHNIAAAKGFALCVRVLNESLNAARILREPDEIRPHAHVNERVGLGHGKGFLDDLDPLALQREGKARVVLQHSVIEFGDPFALFPVPVMKQRRDDAARLELFVEPDVVVHLERRWMVRTGARHLGEEPILGKLLDEGARNALFGKLERQTQAHGTCPYDQHAVVGALHVSCGISPALWRARRPSPPPPSPYG
jgi:hypothetical protein